MYSGDETNSDSFYHNYLVGLDTLFNQSSIFDFEFLVLATGCTKWEFSHFNLTALLNVGIITFVTQKSTTMLADCKNTMNHDSRRRTMAAIVPRHCRGTDSELCPSFVLVGTFCCKHVT
jgi:hypothetical protein